MARLGEGRIEAISLAILRALKQAGFEIADDGAAVRTVAERLEYALGGGTSHDAAVRARIASLSRKVVEGSREWDVLYRQYSEELARRR